MALTEEDGYSTVDRVIPGGAADKLGDEGLRTGDRIIAVAEEGDEPENIIDVPLRDAVKLIRGKKGTTVELTVLRQEGDEAQRFDLAIVRDKIDLAEQAATLEFETREVDGKEYKLAVIELPSFYGDPNPELRQCTDDIEALLAQVQEEGADGLLIDLSRNGGGLLEHAVKISGFFIRKGEVVGVQNARGQLSVLQDRDERILYSGPLVVHTSRMSASASEILAGALKDYHRAVITGDDHTFGKGTVQTVTQLPPGQGAIKVTTAVFFRPGGKSTQKDGVHADVVIPTVLSADDTGEVSQPYALPGETIQPFLSSHANALTPGDRWSYVPVRTIAELARRSQERISGNEEFGELTERIQKIRDADGVMKLSELMKEREEAKAKEEAERAQEEAEKASEAPGPGAAETQTDSAAATPSTTGFRGRERDRRPWRPPTSPTRTRSCRSRSRRPSTCSATSSRSRAAAPDPPGSALRTPRSHDLACELDSRAMALDILSEPSKPGDADAVVDPARERDPQRHSRRPGRGARRQRRPLRDRRGVAGVRGEVAGEAAAAGLRRHRIADGG